MTRPTVQVYLVEARTGCSCCAYENFLCGPFLSESDAQAKVEAFRAERRLASQFAKNGCYSVRAYEAEDLGDGRYIIADEVWNMPYEEKRP